MKLLIQIPCYNEEATLPLTLADLPREIDGVDEIEVLVIDDGSTDRTLEVAQEHGVHHFVRFTRNKGLAQGFMAGLDACLRLGADIIVNTDGDNQYRGADISKLIQPILEGQADMVVGARPIANIDHFSLTKKWLHRLGNAVVRRVSGTSISDVTSGFRAFSREAALRLNVISDFTYTLETVILAGKKDLALASVDVGTNEKLRESRLFPSLGQYLWKSVATILRIYAVYEPLKAFSWLGGLLFLGGGAGGTAVPLFLLHRQRQRPPAIPDPVRHPAAPGISGNGDRSTCGPDRSPSPFDRRSAIPGAAP